MEQEIFKILIKYQSERIGGRWYIERTGLLKVAKLLNGNFDSLTVKQKKIFHKHCVGFVLDGTCLMDWNYYINN